MSPITLGLRKWREREKNAMIPKELAVFQVLWEIRKDYEIHPKYEINSLLLDRKD
jgi:hypothetical protein